MNVLFIEYAHSHFYQQRKLTSEGHNVWTTWDDSSYNRSYGIQHLDLGFWRTWTPENCQLLIDKITELQIDAVIVAIPWLHWLRDLMPDTVTYLGATKEASALETDKFATRSEVEGLGLNVIPVVGEGRTDALDLTTYTERPVVLKAKNSIDKTWIIGQDQDGEMEIMCNAKNASEHYDYYLEQFLPDFKTEALVYFMVAEGKWSIFWIGGMEGEPRRREVYHDDSDGPWMAELTHPKLTEIQKQNVLAYATTFLNWAVTKGGNYCGSIDLAIDKNDDVYWVECNVRNDSYDCLPCTVSGETYINALKGEPSLYPDTSEYNLTPFVSTTGNLGNQEYPFHLHAEHGVEVPNCLSKDGDKYRTYCGAIVIHHIGELPPAFVEALTEYKILKEVT